MKVARPLLYFRLLCISSIAFLFSCKSGPINLFKPSSPHEAYQRKLITAGLDKTAMGTSWISAADESLQKALTITIPFKETGYFAAERIPASSYKFTATQGQKLNISLTKNPADQFMIYMDLWELADNGAPKLMASADTLGKIPELEVKATGTYILRLQPELLRSGQYTLEITSGPSLGFPVKSSRANIGSIFGDGRDANTRKHEGIDIFDTFHTPVIAAAAGTVVRVNENNLGGLVVWMRPTGKDYTLYYAHLDKQIAIEGQQVKPGDTLGLMGNTGNAKTTPPHLHFGVYTNGGAVNPLPYVNPLVKNASKITASLSFLNTTARTSSKSAIYQSNASKALLTTLKAGTIVHVNAANESWFTVQLPNGLTGFIPNKQLGTVNKALKQLIITEKQRVVYDRPDSLAAVKMNLTAGKSVAVLGDFENYHLIESLDKQTGWIKM